MLDTCCGDMLRQTAAVTVGPDAQRHGICLNLLCLSLLPVLQGRTLKESDGFTGFERFMCGLLAGTLAKLGTHPLDVAKKRYQVAGLQRDLRWAGGGCSSSKGCMLQASCPLITYTDPCGACGGAAPTPRAPTKLCPGSLRAERGACTARVGGKWLCLS